MSFSLWQRICSALLPDMQMRKEGVYVETYASLPSSVLALPALMTVYQAIARRYPHTD